MSSPLLKSLNLVARDMDATISFYRRLGLEIPESSVWRTGSGPHHVDLKLPGGLGLDLDSSQLAEHYNAGWRETGSGGGRCVIGFSVATREAVDERYAELTAAGYVGLQPPYDAFWGARYAIVQDPDGNPVGLMSPRDPARRGPPPAL